MKNIDKLSDVFLPKTFAGETATEILSPPLSFSMARDNPTGFSDRSVEAGPSGYHLPSNFASSFSNNTFASALTLLVSSLL